MTTATPSTRLERPGLASLACASLACAGLTAGPASASQESATAFVGARILPIAGPEIASGVLVIQAGKIVAVGPQATVEVPEDATLIDVSGKTLMPGLVDTHSHVGGGWAADRSAPIQPEVSVFDAIDVRDSGFQRAQAGGITTANVMPGSGHLMSGQTTYLKLRDANTIEEWVVRDAEGEPMGVG